MFSHIVKAALLAVLFSPAAYADEKDISFKDLSYPIVIKLSAAHNAGDVLFESAFSEAPSADYDTVLLQGEMPDPNIRLELVVMSKTAAADGNRYQQSGFHRFPSGRFWAKYRVGQLGRQPLKFSVINLGLKSDSSLTIYGTELVKEALLREEREPQASTAVPYVPDPSLFLPDSAPFKVVRRKDWQAAPPKEPYTPHTPFYFTIHHTQSHYPKTFQESVGEMQFIQDFHQNGRGWIDIAYHFLIDPMGNVFEGRPIGVVGAHVKGHNTGNIGISIMGNYHPPTHDIFTDATKNSFVTIGRYLKDTYAVNVSSFYAHREIGNTDCPGDDLYAKKPELRDLIFTPQVQPVPVNAQDAPPLTPAQKQSLDQLMNYLSRQ